MSKDKLLSDEELLDELERLRFSSNPLAVVDLINTQKRLYAESVIGEDVDEGSYTTEPQERIKQHEVRAINRKLAEQRARIK